MTYSQGGASPIDPGAGLSIVAEVDASPALGQEIVDCVTTALVSGLPQARLVPYDEIHSSLFPGLPWAAAPLGRSSLEAFSRDESFQDRVAAAGVRYIVTVEGYTIQPKPAGGLGCAYYGCWGGWVWRRDSTVRASILDLVNGEVAGGVEARVSGRPWLGVLGIFPIGAPSFTEFWACRTLGQGILDLLRTRAATGR